MNIPEACHEIALETAKTFVSTNMPEYIHSTGTTGYTRDMVEKYIAAYKQAEEIFQQNDAAKN